MSKNERKGIEITYRGNVYKSLSKLCSENNLSIGCFKYRIKQGMAVEEAIERENMLKKPIEYKGIKYESISALSRALNISLYTLYSRLKKGMEVEEAINTKTKRSKRSIEYKGKIYETIRLLADELNLDYRKLLYLLTRNDYNIEKVIAILEKEKEKLVLWGVEYKNITQIANKYGLEHKYFYKKYKELKEENSLDSIVMMCMSDRSIDFDGKIYRNLADLASSNGILIGNLIHRLSTGWDLYSAVYTPIKKIAINNSIEYNGKMYSSKCELLREYGIDAALVNNTSRHNNLDWYTTFKIIEEFSSKYLYVKPSILTYIPYVIYRDTAYRSIKELAEDCNTSITQLKGYMKLHKVDIFEALKLMSSEKIKRYAYNGEIYSTRELRDTLNSSIDTLLKRGIIEEVMTRKFPDVVYSPTERDVLVRKLFDEELEKVKGITNKD